MHPVVSTRHAPDYAKTGRAHMLLALCLAAALLLAVILSSGHHHSDHADHPDCALCAFAHQPTTSELPSPIIFAITLSLLPVRFTPLAQVAPAVRPNARPRNRAPPTR
jgi:hypothetical protein